MSNVPFLGSKISLISKSEIRYEGILYTVDTKDSTVALAKVRSFGTEDRPTERPLAPRDEVYEYIIFRASDIKDLHVCESPISHGLIDPAIVKHSQPITQPQYSSVPCAPTFGTVCGLPQFHHYASQSSYIPSVASSHQSSSRSSVSSAKRSLTSDAGVQVSVGNAGYRQSSRDEPRDPLKPRNREPTRPSFQQRRRVPSQNRDQSGRRNVARRGRGRSGERLQLEKYENDYDFEQANAEFQELEKKLLKNSIDDKNVQPTSSLDDSTGAYDREKSFFDDISCEASERSKGFDWRYERKLNLETFGVSATNSWLRRRGRGGFRRPFRGRGNYSRPMDMPVQHPQKTVTFNETPVIKEVEVVTLEDKPAPIPVIEVIVETEATGQKSADWPEPAAKTESVWN